MVQILAWRRLTHMCVTRPQWVNVVITCILGYVCKKKHNTSHAIVTWPHTKQRIMFFCDQVQNKRLVQRSYWFAESRFADHLGVWYLVCSLILSKLSSMQYHGPLTYNCRLRMRRGCRERFSRHRLQRKPLVSDPGMHHDTCVTHMPWCMSESLTRDDGENIPGIPDACANPNFIYLARGPWGNELMNWQDNQKFTSRKTMYFLFLIVWKNGSIYQVNIDSTIGLWPDGTKSFSQPMLTFHQRYSVVFMCSEITPYEIHKLRTKTRFWLDINFSILELGYMHLCTFHTQG